MIPLHIAKLHFNRVLPDAPFQLDTVPSQAGYADDWCSASFCTACASRSCLQFLAGVLGTVSSSSSRAACFDITLPSPRNSCQPNTFWPVKRQKFHQIDWFLSQFRLARFYHRVMLGGERYWSTTVRLPEMCVIWEKRVYVRGMLSRMWQIGTGAPILIRAVRIIHCGAGQKIIH